MGESGVEFFKHIKMATKITFEDNGQDFLWWAVDGEGNVVDCGPFQASVWVGSVIIDHELLNPGDEVEFISNQGDVLVLKHKVETIEQV